MEWGKMKAYMVLFFSIVAISLCGLPVFCVEVMPELDLVEELDVELDCPMEHMPSNVAYVMVVNSLEGTMKNKILHTVRTIRNTATKHVHIVVLCGPGVAHTDLMRMKARAGLLFSLKQVNYPFELDELPTTFFSALSDQYDTMPKRKKFLLSYLAMEVSIRNLKNSC